VAVVGVWCVCCAEMVTAHIAKSGKVRLAIFI
jgi:hypothetical protein